MLKASWTLNRLLHLCPRGLTALLMACFLLPWQGVRADSQSTPSDAQGEKVPPSDAPIPPLPEGMSFPQDILLLLEDAQFDTALRQLRRQISQNPDDLGLRLARVLAQSAREPRVFVREVSMPGWGPLAGVLPAPDVDALAGFQILSPLGESPADLFEGTVRLWRRLQFELFQYRANGDVAPEDHISRIEEASWVLVEALQAGSVPAGPWLDVALWEAQLWSGKDVDHLYPTLLPWFESAQAVPVQTQWAEFLTLLLFDDGHGALPQSFFDLLLDLKSPWVSKTRLLYESLGMREKSWSERWETYEEIRDQITTEAFKDDWALAYSRRLSRDATREDEYFELILELNEGPWRNTSLDAAAALVKAYREREQPDQALEVCIRYNKEKPPWAEGLLRTHGRLLLKMEDYAGAFRVLTELVESEKAEARDYLYLADAAVHVTSPGDAVKLTDFATAIRERELKVEAWLSGTSETVGAAEFRAFEFMASAKHARYFPETFVGMIALILVETLVLGLSLVIVAGFGRVARKAWPFALLFSALSLLLQLLGFDSTGETSLGMVAGLAFMIYGAVRTFFVALAAVVLGSVTGGRGMAYLRGLKRFLKLGQAKKALLWSLPSVLGAFLLFWLQGQRSEQSEYLARLPEQVGASIMGVRDIESWSLVVNHEMWRMVLFFGFVAGLLLLVSRWLVGQGRLALLLSFVGTTLLAAAAYSGLASEPSAQFLILIAEGSILVCLSRLRGVDGAFIASALSVVLMMGMS